MNFQLLDRALFYSLFFVLGTGIVPLTAQDAITGDFSGGFGNNTSLSASAGNSLIYTTQAPNTNNQYFRFVQSGTQLGPVGCADLDWTGNEGTEYLDMVACNNKAFFITPPNTSDQYIFKTPAASANDFVFFRVQGSIATISSVSQNPGTVYPRQAVTITATLSQVLDPGQGVYLRYSTDNFSSSSIIAMNQSSGQDYTATIPRNAHLANGPIDYYVFTSGDNLGGTLSHSNADWYTINLDNNSGSNYSYTVEPSWTTAQAGDWSQAATWTPGAVPPADAPITINHDVTLDQDATVGDVSISSGHTFTAGDGSLRTLTLISGANLTIDGALSANGAHFRVKGPSIFDNKTGATVDINSAATEQELDFNGSFRILDSLTLLPNGFVLNPTPIYASGSVLIYANSLAVGNPYGLADEWDQQDPYHVRLRNGSHLDLGAGGTGVTRTVRGDLTIDAGCGLFMDYNINDMTAPLVVAGDADIKGSLSLSNKAGGDLKVGGDLQADYASTNLSTLERALFFTGSTAQTMAVKDAIDKIILENNAQVSLQTDVTQRNTSTNPTILDLGSGAQLDIPSGMTLDCDNGQIVNEGTIAIASGGALVQRGTGLSNSGSGTYEVSREITAPDHRRFNYWSSPVQSETMGAVFGSNPNGSGAGPTESSDWYFFDEDIQEWDGTVDANTTLTPGRGYITTPSKQVPANLNPVNDTRVFTGQINEGAVNLPLPGSLGNDEFVLTGNPYPSAISAQDFLQGNSALWGTVFFWDHTSSTGGGTQGTNYQADYASWNLLGSNAIYSTAQKPNATPGKTPNGYISSGQGFFVKTYQSGTVPSQIQFTNDMRVADNNSQFFKRSSPQFALKLWLGLHHPRAGFSHTLLGFHPQATAGIDRWYDAPRLEGHPQLSLSSQSHNHHWAIQGLPPRWLRPGQGQAIPLYLRAGATGRYQLRLDSLSAPVQVWLIDSLQGTLTDLRQGPHSFSLSQPDTLEGRFYLWVQRALAPLALPNTPEKTSPELWRAGAQWRLSWPARWAPLQRWQLYTPGGSLVAQQGAAPGLRPNVLAAPGGHCLLKLPDLPRGLYLLRAQARDGQSYQTKLFQP